MRTRHRSPAVLLCLGLLMWGTAGCATGAGNASVATPDVSADDGSAHDAAHASDTSTGEVNGPSDALSDGTTVNEAGGPIDVATVLDQSSPSGDANSDSTSGADVLDVTIPSDGAVPALDVPIAADVQGPPPPLFDHAAIADPKTAACAFSNFHTMVKNGVALMVENVSYTSWESIDGVLVPIQIRGFYARPALISALTPGVVQAHGLGGFAKEEHATGLASLLGMAVIAYTGPGGGTEADNTSEGTPSSAQNGYRMFDTLKDPRGSWFWGHAVAAMRAVTCLQTVPSVDATKLGVTGFSAGGVISLIVASVDPRIDAAVPMSGTGRWDVATQSPAAWQHALLTKAGLTTASAEWTTLLATVEPGALVQNANVPILMVNGSSDEFFPLTAHVATYDAIPSADKRTAIAANFDHGCYGLTGVESKETIEERAKIHAEGGQRFWFRHWLTSDPTYATLPKAPTLTLANVGLLTAATAQVDGGGAAFEVEKVTVFWSSDDAFLWGNFDLDAGPAGTWSKVGPFNVTPNLITYVDVVYKTKGLALFPERFALSSPPSIPAGLVPHIRTIDTCL